MVPWDESPNFLLETDGRLWRIRRDSDGSIDSFERLGSAESLGSLEVAGELLGELLELAGRWLAADRLEDLHSEAAAVYSRGLW